MNNLIDSSAWLEYFADSKYAKNFADIIEKQKNIIIPAIVIYEVFKKVLYEKDESTALQIVAYMKQGTIIELNMDIALYAARLSKKHKLPMANSIILATARTHNAKIWTMDCDFKGIEGVEYFKK